MTSCATSSAPAASTTSSSGADGFWGIVLRQPIYEQDRLNPVDPASVLALDPARLERFPVGYRHLAYLQEQIGFAVKPDMPGLTGPEVEALYARGAAWLEGSSRSARAAARPSGRRAASATRSAIRPPLRRPPR